MSESLHLRSYNLVAMFDSCSDYIESAQSCIQKCMCVGELYVCVPEITSYVSCAELESHLYCLCVHGSQFVLISCHHSPLRDLSRHQHDLVDLSRSSLKRQKHLSSGSYLSRSLSLDSSLSTDPLSTYFSILERARPTISIRLQSWYTRLLSTHETLVPLHSFSLKKNER